MRQARYTLRRGGLAAYTLETGPIYDCRKQYLRTSLFAIRLLVTHRTIETLTQVRNASKSFTMFTKCRIYMMRLNK